MTTLVSAMWCVCVCVCDMLLASMSAPVSTTWPAILLPGTPAGARQPRSPDQSRSEEERQQKQQQDEDGKEKEADVCMCVSISACVHPRENMHTLTQ
jgi:hypothetical protein